MSLPSSDRDASFGQLLFTMQIIVLALCSGVVAFLGIAMYLRLSGAQPDGGTAPLLTYLALGFGVLMFGLHLFVPDAVLAASRRQESGRLEGLATPEAPADVGKLCALYQTRMIIACAMIEGAAFFALIAYLLEGGTEALVVAILLLLCLGARFPTRDRVERWIEMQRT